MDITLSLNDIEVAAIQSLIDNLPLDKGKNQLTIEQWFNTYGKSDLNMIVDQFKHDQAQIIYQKYLSAPDNIKASVDAIDIIQPSPVVIIK